MTQKEALDILKMGHNAFVTGAAGSGKTHLLNEYIGYLKKQGVGVGITASTGIAATHMGGTTIHAWSGLGIRDKLTDRDIDELEERSYLWNRYKDTSVLIIDEISMLHDFRLDLVDKLARSFKRNDKPFGGMQVILCGDFFQLPPVSRGGEAPARFAYHSKAWRDLNLKICYLEESHRQNDDSFLSLLNSVRDGLIDEGVYEQLKTRFNGEINEEGIATKLYTHNRDVDAENMKELEKLAGDLYSYPMSSRGGDNLAATLKKGCLAPETLHLKEGARVMFVKNHFDGGYANGTLGVVEECSDFEIKVKTLAGKIIEVVPASWSIEENGKVKAEITQYPLRLAWAITVHKSQGMSLDCAEVDLSQSFERGMGYVALSRIRSLKGLSLKGMNQYALMVSEEVLEMDKEFRKISKSDANNLAKMSASEINKKQESFISRVGGLVKTKKEKKPETTSETARLLAQGMDIAEIAKERGIKEGTVLDHLEKLKKSDKNISFNHLKKSIPSARLKKIITALRKGGMEDGVYRLTPAKVILGNEYSFEEIRLARLLM
jgi:hypothetical protein